MSLYLGAISFEGDLDELLPAYRRLTRQFPVDSLDLHVAVTHTVGLTVYDACPTKEIFDEFTSGETFLAAVAAAGLPTPRIDGLGEVLVVHVREGVRA